MKFNHLMNLSLQQIQIFLKCYEYHNFSRVAEEYDFTPSMVSKTVKNIEQMLGIRLFDRKYHQLLPTSAASELAKGFEKCLRGTIETIYRACKMQEANTPKIRIGVLETTQFCADYIMIKLEHHFSSACIDTIEWERKDMHALPEALNQDQMDLVITWSGELRFFSKNNTCWKKIFSSPDAVFVPRGHDLFGKKLTSFKDCSPYPFITLSPSNYPHYADYLDNICHKNGFTPIFSTVCGSTDSARYNLNLGKGLYVAPSLICCDWENEDIEKKEFTNEDLSSLIIAWKKEKETPILLKIVNSITH